MENTPFEYWKKIAETLEKGGLTDPEMYPDLASWVRLACEIFWETFDFCPLRELICKHPWLMDEAERNIAESEKANEELPYRFDRNKCDMSLLNGDVKIGTVIPYGDDIFLKLRDLIMHMAIYARSGTGKTLLMRLIIKTLLDCNVPILCFDVKRDYLDMFRLHKQVCVLSKKHLMYNHFQVHEPQSKEDIEESMRLDVKVLADALYFGPTGVPIIEESLRELFREKGVYNGSEKWPTFSDVLMKIRDKNIKGGLKIADILASFETRFPPFMNTTTFDCERGLPISFFRNNPVIIDTSGMDEAERPLLANGLAMKLYRHNLKNNLRSTELRHVILYDEGYHYHDAELTDESSYFSGTSSGKTLFRMGREFGLSFIVSGTQVGSISKYVRENTATIIAFKTQDQSLKMLQDTMGLNDDQKDYFYKLPSKFVGVARLPDFEHPLLFKLDVSDFPQKDVTDSDIDAHMSTILKDVMGKQGVGKIRRMDLREIGTESITRLNAIAILQAVKKDPYKPFTDIRSALSLSSEKFETALEWLAKEELVEIRKLRSSEKKYSKYIILTESGNLSLNVSRPVLPAHFKHSLFCERVRRWLEKEGCHVKKEYTGAGSLYNPNNDRIDVFAEQTLDGSVKRVAYEITLSVSEKDIMPNVTKCMTLFKVDQLWMVCENENTKRRVRKIVEHHALREWIERTSYTTISSFL